MLVGTLEQDVKNARYVSIIKHTWNIIQMMECEFKGATCLHQRPMGVPVSAYNMYLQYSKVGRMR
jgi:hypothetical protein